MTETPETPTPGSTAAEKRAAAQAAAAAEPTAVTPAENVQAESMTSVQPAAAAAPHPSAFSKQAPQPAAPRATSKRQLGIAAAIVAAALVGGVSGAGASLWAVSMNQQSPIEQASAPTSITVNDPDNATNTTAVAVKAAASVVTISVKSADAGGSGSGVVLSDDGYVLTNTHVVTLEGATADPDVTVTTSDGRLFTATVIGTDPIADLAVIKLDNASGLVPMKFADSDALNVGDTAIAIGAPLGLAGTVTDGIISSLNRSISIASSAAPDASDGGSDSGAPKQGDPNSPFDFWQFDVPGQGGGSQAEQPSSSQTISLPVIQTDAAINPGNSGGALLDSAGKLIGINVAIATAGQSSGAGGSIGVGFAIPSNFAQRIAKEIIDTGSATHGLLGASVLDVTEDTKAADSATVGASIQEISAGGAADKAGLKVGDVITKIDGVHITGKTDLTAQVRAHAAGSEATITYTRGGKSGEVTATLGTLKV